MRTALLVVVFAFFSGALSAQTTASADDSIPAYKRIPTIPPFKLMLVPDSTAFTKDDLQKKTSTVIMVFSPDCEHCVRSTEDLLAHYDLFKNSQIVMGTFLSYDHIQKFYKEHKIADYPAIKMGLDNSYFLGTFYGVHMYPAIFVYDKHGNFKEYFEGSVKWEKIAQAL